MATDSHALVSRCIAIDLEVGRKDERVHAFAAVRGDTGETLVFRGRGDLLTTLAKLDAFASDADFLLGHNIVGFDRPHLAAARPGLALLRLPAIDTLRLNPLAFPRNPYHRLVKHYQDGQLQGGRRNDPEWDARLALELFGNQLEALAGAPADLLLAWHRLTTAGGGDAPGPDAVFSAVRRAARPGDGEVRAAIVRLLSGSACTTGAQAVADGALAGDGWPLAYALAWLGVAGGNSVMPPWVRHQFPEAGTMVRRLRDSACRDPACGWCRERHDASRELARWFGFSTFREEPRARDGRPLQQVIAEAAMAGEHVLGIMPTGTGKSVCYQLPALSRYDKTGVLTVVISPLVALMADQVAGLEARGITACSALNGLLSMPERADVLERVRMGDVGILIVSPEQLRNRTFRRVLAQREVGAWVLDEAHCLSKWGHDFRPDYRYVGRFIRERSRDGHMPPVLCLTATAKPDVVQDIVSHFAEKLGIGLVVFDGGASRGDLEFSVVPTSPSDKLAHLHQMLLAELPTPDLPGGAIVYCATRRHAEEVASYLREKSLSAECFHAGLPPETKKSVQQRFVRGELRVIAATNAFGMGIDKPDVRLVIHADVPGSLENYLQEAGRAGRDRGGALCVLLYADEDVERQFALSARSRLTQREVQSVLRALRNLDRRKSHRDGEAGEIVATAGEILAEDDEGGFGRDSATDDTRVRTAVTWLEEAELLSREENRVQVFPSSLRVSSVEEARTRLEKHASHAPEDYKRRVLAVVQALVGADSTEGVSTDELMAASGLDSAGVRRALFDLERLGIASNDAALTAFVSTGVERSSRRRFEAATALEQALVDAMRETAPDLEKGQCSELHLRHASQRLKDAGLDQVMPERLWRLLKGLAADGRGEEGGTGSLGLRRLGAEMVQVTLHRDWDALARTAQLRRSAASVLLEHLLGRLPPGSRGVDLLAETTLGSLLAVLRADLAVGAEMKDPPKLLDRALLWLHEQEVIRLNRGLTVFRPAMTIRLARGGRGFTRSDFEPLRMHYEEQVLQIHVMAEYVQRGLRVMAEALQLAMDYFTLERGDFLRRWLAGREKDLGRQTTPESWRAIVEALRNPTQQRIVADDREETSVLVLAGPGSGKTRVLVHRIAFLVRVRREDPRGILALAYNRHAAVEIRRRLRELIGDDARALTVLTCDALAMRMVGVSIAERSAAPDGEVFRKAKRDAAALLRGEGLTPEEADEQRERLLAGFRWILIDEYQDIAAEEYDLVSALAGRSLDHERKLSLFAVGDDDQNIYSFKGASVEFIRRFEADYGARPTYLVEDFRSSAAIIDAANSVIERARDRMKRDHPIVIDRARRKDAAGGPWAALDPVAKGRVQVLPVGSDDRTQAIVVMEELRRLAGLAPGWDWARVAVIAREWKRLDPVRCWCELYGVPSQSADELQPSVWRLRETGQLVDWVRARDPRLVTSEEIAAWLARKPAGHWWDLVRQAAEEYALEVGTSEQPTGYFTDWLADWSREARRRQTGLLLLSAHRAKGLEFDHVVVLDGGWDRVGRDEDHDAARRLYYVAMSRARRTLTLARMAGRHPFLDDLPDAPWLLHRTAFAVPEPRPDLSRTLRRLELAEVDLGFAGRKLPGHAVHRAIEQLQTGGRLVLSLDDGRWVLRDERRCVVGRLSAAFEPPPGMVCAGARVAAILRRSRADEAPEYLRQNRSERWEVVVPELTFEPG
jgi:ATP-dependent DNA helicase RecQ